MKNFFIGLMTVVLVLAFMYGVVAFLMWDNNNDKARHAEKCAQVAKLAGVTEYKVDYSTCYLLKDGKIEVVE